MVQFDNQELSYVQFAATAQLFLRLICNPLAILICALSSVLSAQTLQERLTEAVA